MRIYILPNTVFIFVSIQILMNAMIQKLVQQTPSVKTTMVPTSVSAKTDTRKMTRINAKASKLK